MDNFNIITEEDKSNMSYGACVGGHALVGMAVGRLLALRDCWPAELLAQLLAYSHVNACKNPLRRSSSLLRLTCAIMKL